MIFKSTIGDISMSASILGIEILYRSLTLVYKQLYLLGVILWKYG